MAKYQTPPKSLKEADEIAVKDFIVATEQKFKGDLFGEVNSNFNESYTTPDGRFHWESVRDLFNYITTLTETNDIRSANAVLYQTLTPIPKFEEPTMTNTTALRSDELTSLDEERVAREKAIAETEAKAERQTQEFLDREKKKAERLHELLKDKKVYAKVIEGKEVSDLSPQEIESVTELQKAVNENPKEVFKQLSEEIKSKLPANTPDEAIQMAAYDAVEALRSDPNVSLGNQTAFLSGFISSPAVISKITEKSPEKAKEITDSVVELSNSRISQRELSKKLFGHAFGNNIARAVFRERVVELSEVKTQEFTREVDLSQVAQSYSTEVTNQQDFFDSIKGLGYDQLDSRLRTHLGGIIERKIATLPEGHILRSNTVKTILSSYGLGTAVEWTAIEGASPLIKFAVSSGYGPLLGTIQKATGWNLGVTKLVGEAAKKVVGAEVVAGTVAKAGTGFLAKIVAAISGVTGPVGLAVTAAVTFVASKLAKLIPWDKIEKFINNFKEVLFGAGILGLMSGSLGLQIAGGLSALAGGSAIFSAGGISTAGIGAAVGGIGRVFSFAASTALAGIGGPILFILLGFPVIVALILFIINSGAYIVPPSPLNLNLGGFESPYVDITKTANPPGPFSNSDFPEEITYTITIKPKKGNLNNVQLSYDCQVISRDSLSCPNIQLQSGFESVFTTPIDSVSATGLTFTYTSTYSNQYRDSAIIDTVKLNAVTTDGNQATTETNASVQFGTPPISCPIIGGHVATPSLNYSFNSSNNTGHGSAAYWQAMGQGPSSYSLPQSSGCHSPSECSYYGYAYDVFPPGSRDVYAPTVLGKDITWNCSYGFVNRASGHTYICTGDGYTLVLTHMASGARTGTINSGEKIGTLFNQVGNTHLHIEFQINGRYVKPENYFCGGQ